MPDAKALFDWDGAILFRMLQGGRVVHAVHDGGFPSRVRALCGCLPSKRSPGWGSRHFPAATCPHCVRRLARVPDERLGPPPPPTRPGEFPLCPNCRQAIGMDRSTCRVCGASYVASHLRRWRRERSVVVLFRAAPTIEPDSELPF